MSVQIPLNQQEEGTAHCECHKGRQSESEELMHCFVVRHFAVLIEVEVSSQCGGDEYGQVAGIHEFLSDDQVLYLLDEGSVHAQVYFPLSQRLLLFALFSGVVFLEVPVEELGLAEVLLGSLQLVFVDDAPYQVGEKGDTVE